VVLLIVEHKLKGKRSLGEVSAIGISIERLKHVDPRPECKFLEAYVDTRENVVFCLYDATSKEALMSLLSEIDLDTEKTVYQVSKLV